MPSAVAVLDGICLLPRESRHLPRCVGRRASLMSGDGARNHRHAENRPGAAQPHCRRSRGQRRQAAQGSRRGRGARAPISSSFPSCSSPAIRPRTWCASRRCSGRARGGRGAGGGDRRRRPRRARSAPSGPEDGKLYNAAVLLDGGRIAGRALQGRPAQLRRVRREARVRRRADAGAGQLPRRAHRRADLRGHLERRGVRVPAGDGRGNADRAQRLAVRLAQARPAHERRGRARDGDRAAAALSQPGRRPGRTGVRRRLVRAQRRRGRSPCSCRPGRRRSRRPRCGARARRLALRRRASAPRSRSTTPPPITPACWACATTSTRTAFPGVVLGLSGGIDSRACRGHGRRRAGRGARALRDAALPLHLPARAWTTPRTAPRRWACATTSCRSSRAVEGFLAMLSRLFAGTSADIDRGEHPVARARRDADGDLQQVRRAWC